MKNLNSEKTKVVNEKKNKTTIVKNKTRILIVGHHPLARQGLTQLVNQESDCVVCAEAENANQISESIEKKHVDLAIVDIFTEGKGGSKLAEKIKLEYPNLPILMLSIDDESLYAKHAPFEQKSKYLINHRATEQIIRAVRYVQSLLENHVFGFTVLVKT